MGNLTHDLEIKYTPSGIAVLEFSLAINRKWKDKEGNLKEEVSFIGCVAWQKTAELIAQYLKKGSGLFVEGRLNQESYEDKNGKKVSKTKVVVENVQFLGKKREDVG